MVPAERLEAPLAGRLGELLGHHFNRNDPRETAPATYMPMLSFQKTAPTFAPVALGAAPHTKQRVSWPGFQESQMRQCQSVAFNREEAPARGLALRSGTSWAPIPRARETPTDMESAMMAGD
eukprot:958233-Pyramimonas_sp.AAC.1